VTDSPSFHAVVAALDALNAADPRHDAVDGAEIPREVAYAQRMSACLGRLYPEASEVLRIAARAQHVRRWEIQRADYPVGRDGYNAWRIACREHHVTLTSAILRQHGYADADISHVAKMIRKQDLKRDADSQALENVAAVVFVEHYLTGFAAAHPDHSDEKLVAILRKTLRKMDAAGHAAIRKLALPQPARRLVELALTSRL
jgi:hypothetical protein